MNKSYWIMILMLLIFLVACDKNVVIPEDEFNQEGIVNQEEPMPEGQLETPPDIYVISGDQKIKAVQGTTSWTIDLGNGKMKGYEADSDAPMGLVKYQQEGMIVKPDDVIVIQGEFDRGSVRVVEWNDEGPGEVILLKNNGFIVPPSEASRVYEIRVNYKQGMVYYAFKVTLEKEVLVHPTTEALDALQKAYNKDPYDYATDTEVYKKVVSLGKGTIEYCRESLTDISFNTNKKFYEWLISETIRTNFPEVLYIGRKEYFETTIKSDCRTYAMVGEDELYWSELKKDTLIQITEMLNMDYFIGHRIGEAFTDDTSDIDNVEFIIKREDLTYPFNKEIIDYYIPRLSSLNEYNLVAVSDETPVTDEAGRSFVKIPVYDQPSEAGTFIGYVYSGDLLKYSRDDNRQVINSGDWSLVDIIPYDWCINSNSAWIPNEHLTPVTEETVANAGFVLVGTKLYSEPDLGSLALLSSETDDPNFLDPFRYGDVYCVRVHGEEGDFYKISDEVNGNVHGYVEKEDLFFYVDDQLVNQLQTFNPNMDLFISMVKSRIVSWDVELSSKDWHKSYTLTTQEKNKLAKSLESIDEWEGFDGGIRPYREAAYPYISLDLGDGELVVVEDGRLLVIMGQEEAYRYGIGTRGMPIRFMMPNKEFIDQLASLVDVPENDNPDNMIYLLKAKKLEIIDDEAETGSVFDQQVHINHAVRGIINVLGNPLKEEVVHTLDHKHTFRFTMPDEEIIEIIYEDSYILYRDKWYQASKDVRDTLGNMFAAYF